MKNSRASALSVLVLAAGVIRAAAVAGFGPASCVTVSRSNAGTCVVHTKCAGQDLSSFDISFDCLAQSGHRESHSMGVGSFDEEEDYDTDLKCQECLAPVTSAVTKATATSAVTTAIAGLSLASVSVSREVSKLHETAPKAEWYGPDECVGVWRDEKTGHCVMQTDCDKDTQINVYEFGLICTNEDNEMTRHLFGMGSFAHKETFDTLIECSKCQALDEYMNGAKAVNKLTDMVKGMKDDLKDVSSSLGKLNAEVFPQAPAAAGPAPAAASPAPAQAPPAKAKAPPAKPAKFLVAPAEEVEATPPQGPQPRPAIAAAPIVIAHLARVNNKQDDVVQHFKVKKSQEQSMKEILSAAVQGAQDRGAVLSTAKKQELDEKQEKALTRVPKPETDHPVPEVVQRTQQIVSAVIAHHEAGYPGREHLADDDDDDDAEEDHSKDEEEDEDA